MDPKDDYPEVVDYFPIAKDLDYSGEAVNRAFDFMVSNNRPDCSRSSSPLMGDSGHL